MRIYKKRRFIKRLIPILVAILLVSSLSACGGADTSDEEDAKNDPDKLTIGMSIDSLIIERWQRDCDVFVAKIKEYESNADVNIQNANGDIETQKQQIQYLIDKNVDALVIVCIDSNSLSEVIDKAHMAGIPVIAYDRLIMNSNVDLYISFDNEKVGELMGQALVDAGLPNKKVLMLSGPEEDHNVSMITTSFKKVMRENNVEITDNFHTPNWKAEEAAGYLSEHLNEINGVDAIMCGNDNIATRVIRTLAEARLAGKIKIVGQDADLEACQRVVEGTQVMTVYKPVEKLAQAAAEYAVQLAKNKELSGVTNTISDGTNEVPYVFLDPIAVTKDNIDETVIESGFHTKDDVYLNVVD
ncbi:D-xylose transport system substrate-binding protein [Lachnospiraceae bacterium]|nr:D-xylose transport system substrate-binding protein [Lachnospiraceae bacterium]